MDGVERIGYFFCGHPVLVRSSFRGGLKKREADKTGMGFPGRRVKMPLYGENNRSWADEKKRI